jgi:hypothetical protein
MEEGFLITTNEEDDYILCGNQRIFLSIEICDEIPSRFYCVICQQSQCEDCLTLSHKSEKKKKHITDGNVNTITSKQKKCETHQNPFSLVCIDCEELVCTSCITLNQEHSGHKVSLFKDSSEFFEKKTSKQKKNLKEIKHQLDVNLKLLELNRKLMVTSFSEILEIQKLRIEKVESTLEKINLQIDELENSSKDPFLATKIVDMKEYDAEVYIGDYKKNIDDIFEEMKKTSKVVNKNKFIFKSVAGTVEISGDGTTAMISDREGHHILVGSVSYSSGVHNWRFSIDTINGSSKWMSFGVSKTGITFSETHGQVGCYAYGNDHLGHSYRWKYTGTTSYTQVSDNIPYSVGDVIEIQLDLKVDTVTVSIYQF